MEGLSRDFVLAVRTFLKRPGFTAAALLSMALGIGANSAIFTLVDAALLRPLPVGDPARVVLVYGTEGPGNDLPVSFPTYEDLRDRSRTLSGLAAFQWLSPTLLHGEPRKIFILITTASYFDVLGVPAALGRTFTPQDESGGAPVAVVSDRFWRQELGADPGVLGRTIPLAGQSLTVVGVAPRDFKGTNLFRSPDLWVPMGLFQQLSPYRQYFKERGAQMFEMVGRLAPDASLAQARAELSGLAAQLERDHPENQGEGAAILPLAQAAVEPQVRGSFVRGGAFLMAVVGLLLLIACGNVASLMLTRGLEQRKEIAIRLALGAGRGQLVRQLLVQSLVLSLAGGALGLLLGHGGTAFLWSLRPPHFALADLDLGLDGRIALFTFVLAVVSGLLFGLAPALRATRPELTDALRDEQPHLEVSARRLSLRDLLVVAQVALCFLALTGAGLFLKSLGNAQQIAPGFDADRLLVATFSLDGQEWDTARGLAFHRRLTERLRSTPGISSVALASNQPLGWGTAFYYKVAAEEGAHPGGGEGTHVRTDSVTPSYFETMGIPRVRGRGFSERDREGTPAVAIVNEAMARWLWPGEDPIGKRFRVLEQENRTLEVIGVARDAKYISLREDPQPSYYMPLRQSYQPAVTIYVRTPGRPEALLPVVRREVGELAPALPLTDVYTMEDIVRLSLWAPRLGAGLLALFGGLALALAITGIYGILAYSVHQRLPEIGVRLALGAERRDVVRLFVRRAMAVVALGLGLGLAGAALGSRLVASMLYGVHPTDPATFAQITGALAVIALLASYTAVRRAAWINPARLLFRSGRSS